MLTDYSRVSAQTALEALASERNGLAPAEAKLRRKSAGAALPVLTTTWLKHGLRAIFTDSFIILLAIALLASRFSGYGHATLLVAIVLAWQLWLHAALFLRGKRFIGHVTRALQTNATVVRSGHRQHVGVDQLVPGDIIELKQGDLVPADLRLLSVNQLVIDEQALPGGAPHAKKETKIGSDNLTFFGGTVLTGNATGVVIACGKHTVLGAEIASPAHVTTYAGAPYQNVLQGQRMTTARTAFALALMLAAYALFAGVTWPVFCSTASLLAVALVPTSAPVLYESLRRRHHAVLHQVPTVIAGCVALKTMLVAISIVGLFSYHVPPAITITQLLLFDFVVLLIPLLASKAAKAHRLTQQVDTTVSVGFGIFLAVLAYLGFLIFFWWRGISPVNIDPASHLYDSAASLALVVGAVGQSIQVLFVSRTRATYAALGIAAILIGGLLYGSGLRSFFATGPLDARDWLAVLCLILLYVALRMVQLHTQRHTRHALLQDHSPEALRKHPKLA